LSAPDLRVQQDSRGGCLDDPAEGAIHNVGLNVELFFKMREEDRPSRIGVGCTTKAPN
jgi:hypothetical protein